MLPDADSLLLTAKQRLVSKLSPVGQSVVRCQSEGEVPQEYLPGFSF